MNSKLITTTTILFWLMKTGMRSSLFLVLIALLAVPLFTSESASLLKESSWRGLTGAVRGRDSIQPVSGVTRPDLQIRQLLGAPLGAAVQPLFSIPQAPDVESVEIYQSDCMTAATDFILGATLCAKITGSPLGSRPTQVLRRVNIVNPSGLIVSKTNVSTDPQTVLFTIPTTATSLFGSETIDNRGTWGVESVGSSGGRRASASFSVSDPAVNVADLSITTVVSGANNLAAGDNVTFIVFVVNRGPGAAANVQITDQVPANSTFISESHSDPAFTCTNPSLGDTGTTTCTINSLPKDVRSSFTLTYQVNAGSPVNTTILNRAEIASTTTQRSTRDKVSEAAAIVTAAPGSGSGCTIVCPGGITVNNTPGQDGANVTYNAPTSSGPCGAISSVPASGSFFGIGTTTVTASNESGDSCTFTVTVTDNQNPTITCPSAITTVEDSPGGGAVVNYPAQTVQDNSGDNVNTNCTPAAGSTFALGTTAVNCVATDPSNNSAECTFNVTVNAASATCALAPPAPITAISDANACGANVTYDSPTVTGSCGPVSCDHPSGSFFPVGTTTVACSVQSGDGAGTTTSFTVTVNDVTKPVPNLSTLPDITRDCSASLIAPTATDSCAGQIQGTTADPTVYTEPGTYTVNWVYSDGHGNTETQQQTVIVNPDSQPPVFDVATLPTVTDECTATVTTTPTATDNCSGEQVTGATTDPLTYTGAGAYTIHWTYTDGSGNSSHQDQTVVVTDSVAPTVALVGAASLTLECHTSFSDPGVTTDDNCQPLNVNVVTTGSVDINTPGTYSLTYTATDGGGNQAFVQRTVTVVDTTSPVITLNGGNSITVECHTSFTDPGATASDTCDSNVPVAVLGSVDVNSPGTYTLTYSASDLAGNPATQVTRTVNVVDTTTPVVTLVGATPVSVECHTSYTDPGASASDSCDTSVPVTVSGSVDVNVPGSYTLTYSATDDSGNSATATRTINVVDTTLPSMTFNSLTIFFNNWTIVFNEDTVTINGQTYPFNGVSFTHGDYTFTFNGQTITINENTYTLEGKTLVLWTPTHQYQTVNVNDLIASATDGCDSGVSRDNVVISQVTSDEVQNNPTNSDGNTLNDVVIAADCKSVQLRAERDNQGNGRVYTITSRVRDATGNTETVTSKINVRRLLQPVVDSGAQYMVTGSCP